MRRFPPPRVTMGRRLAGYAAALSLLVLALAAPKPSVSASCAGLTKKEYERRAEVVFKGRARSGPATEDGRLLSPASFRVLRYVKGSGRRRLYVETATRRSGRGYAVNPYGISPRAGERWKIFGHRAGRHTISPAVCGGSHVTRPAPRRD